MTQFYRTYVPIEGSLRRRLYGDFWKCWMLVWACCSICIQGLKPGIGKPIPQSYGNLGFQSGMGQSFWLPKFVMKVEYQALKKRQ
jgi:hypothetical protein